jgi:hypothetical protein
MGTTNGGSLICLPLRHAMRSRKVQEQVVPYCVWIVQLRLSFIYVNVSNLAFFLLREEVGHRFARHGGPASFGRRWCPCTDIGMN